MRVGDPTREYFKKLNRPLWKKILNKVLTVPFVAPAMMFERIIIDYEKREAKREIKNLTKKRNCISLEELKEQLGFI